MSINGSGGRNGDQGNKRTGARIGGRRRRRHRQQQKKKKPIFPTKEGKESTKLYQGQFSQFAKYLASWRSLKLEQKIIYLFLLLEMHDFYLFCRCYDKEWFWPLIYLFLLLEMYDFYLFCRCDDN
mmetsp:Transcript_21061/g.21455  ORF Transcript_21061/g.21455 Transcript_21061/m.21455 type:complete len:125 (-) Transcript_21061:113-487(-)